MKLSLWPLLGYHASRPRQEVPLNAMVSPSRDWLVGRGRMRRRAGSAIFGDTISGGNEVAGILETAVGLKARRMVSAVLDSITDKFPVPLVLYVYDTLKSALLCWWSSNTSVWKTVGKEFSATHYPDSGLVHHKVVPMVYENEYGGITLHRLNTAEYRQHAFAGSRNLLQVGGEVCTPGYRSAPTRWNGKFNPTTTTGTESVEVFPMGLIPPLTVPVCVPGSDLGTGTVGAWKGSDAFFFSVLFENDRGELSMFAIPRPPNSAWSGYEGFGYMQVDSANSTHYFTSVNFSFIADGPPGTRWKWLCRSSKVTITTSGTGSDNMPSADDLQLMVRLPQGVTSYIDTSGNDLSLDPDPRIQEMFKGGGLQWPPRAADIGQFDGRITLGKLRPNPYALIIAPWEAGVLNMQASNASLYGATSYFVAVIPASLYLRSVIAGVATDTVIALTGKTLRQVVDMINADATVTPTTWAGCTFSAGAHAINLGVLATGVPIGAHIVNAAFPSSTVVTGYYGSPRNGLLVSQNATRSNAGAGEDVTTVVNASGTTRKWAAQVVPGADADESCDSLLRTYVGANCRFSIAAGAVVTTADAPYITPGMLVYGASGGANPWPAGTVVLSTTATTITLSNAATRNDVGALEVVDIGYDTGDRTLSSATAPLPGFVRTFGLAFPMVCPWNKTYLDKFRDSVQDTIFSAASPGYAQDGLNTWLQRNRQGAASLLGQFMGMADLGPYELQFYSRGRIRLWNPRTGLTHSDTDYTKSVVSWTRGARSPYAICHGNGWAAFVSDGGVYGCTAAEGDDRPIGKALYDPTAAVGQRGELEYALEASIAASESDSDNYMIHMQVHGSVLYLRYWSSEAAGHPDREVRYDFSESAGRAGLAELLREDGSAYPWSAPLTYNHSVSAMVSQSARVKHYAALDTNAGTMDGRVDEIDYGTEDNGTPVRPVAYTGLHFEEGLDEVQPTMAYVVSTKAGTGLTVSTTRQPELDPDTASWDVLDIDSSGTDAFGRSVEWLKPEAALRRAAVGVRIWDDGTGPCPEVSGVLIDASKVPSTTGSKRTRK